MLAPKVGFELGADLAHIQFISKARYFGQSNSEQKVFQHAVCITRRLYFSFRTTHFVIWGIPRPRESHGPHGPRLSWGPSGPLKLWVKSYGWGVMGGWLLGGTREPPGVFLATTHTWRIPTSFKKAAFLIIRITTGAYPRLVAPRMSNGSCVLCKRRHSSSFA